MAHINQFNEINLAVSEAGEPVLKVFPNPFHDVITFESEDFQDQLLKITDIKGNSVLTEQTSDMKVKTDLSFLSPGIYLVQLGNGKPVRLVKN